MSCLSIQRGTCRRPAAVLLLAVLLFNGLCLCPAQFAWAERPESNAGQHDCCPDEADPECCHGDAEWVPVPSDFGTGAALPAAGGPAVPIVAKAVPALARFDSPPPDRGPPRYLLCCRFLD